MKIELNDQEIDVQIIRKPNKNIYMRFLDGHTLSVCCNRWITEKEIQRIIAKNQNSLKRMHQQKLNEETKNIFFQYLGKSYTKNKYQKLKIQLIIIHL